MTNQLKIKCLLCLFVSLTLCSTVFSQSQSREEKLNLANISTNGSQVRWDVVGPSAGGTLTIAAPDGQIFQREYRPGAVLELRLNDLKGERLPDGQYTYELRLAPVFSAGVTETLAAARTKGNEGEVQRDLRKRGLIPTQSMTQ